MNDRARRLASMVIALFLILSGGAAMAEPAAHTETVDEVLCRIIDRAATTHGLRRDLFTRLIWQESNFNTSAVSPKGAQGVAQFMPGTASDRGLADPFDPETALPASANYLADLRRDLGNIGLATAGYNAGPDRVRRWLAGTSRLPVETLNYVVAVTGREADDWAALHRGEAQEPAAKDEDKDMPCLEVIAKLRKGRGSGRYSSIALSPLAPWGVQLAGNFSRAVALRSYARESRRYASILRRTRPMILRARLRNRGTRSFYRVRVPAATRSEAEKLCGRIRGAGGSCIVLRS